MVAGAKRKFHIDPDELRTQCFALGAIATGIMENRVNCWKPLPRK